MSRSFSEYRRKEKMPSDKSIFQRLGGSAYDINKHNVMWVICEHVSVKDELKSYNTYGGRRFHNMASLINFLWKEEADLTKMISEVFTKHITTSSSWRINLLKVLHRARHTLPMSEKTLLLFIIATWHRDYEEWVSDVLINYLHHIKDLTFQTKERTEVPQWIESWTKPGRPYNLQRDESLSDKHGEIEWEDFFLWAPYWYQDVFMGVFMGIVDALKHVH